ncbi:MAG: hypothetical protein QOD98_3429, partial [Nocardioidaceae bacterium]|nr:hypothetical protein [Nocardioidaceae bacterium]
MDAPRRSASRRLAASAGSDEPVARPKGRSLAVMAPLSIVLAVFAFYPTGSVHNDGYPLIGL